MKKKIFSRKYIRILSVLLICMIAALMLPAMTASADSYILGDADCTGEVSIIDATVIQRVLAALNTGSYNEAAADVDRDGEGTIIDATLIQRWLAGLSAPAGIGEVIEISDPTEAPTSAPTEAPTEAPTAAPTEAPTDPAPQGLPVITSLTNTVDGIKVDWNGVDGAVGYAVLRKRPEGTWVKLGTTDQLTFTDTTPSSGNEYIFKVRCIDAQGSYVGPNTDTGPSIVYLKAPNLSAVSSANEGVKVNFGTVAGGASYEILRTDGTTGFTVIGRADSSPYIDATAVSGTAYVYTVRAVSTDGARSAYNAEGLSLTYIATPVMKSVKNTFDGVKVEWEASAGAAYYRVFRKFGDDGNWTPKDIVTGTSFIDDAVASGSVYHYTVRCVDAAGEGLSGRDETGLSIMYLKAPNLSAVSSANEGAKIYFGTVAGGASYEILRADVTSGYTVVGSATESPYIDDTVVGGTAYTYSVRAVSADGARSAYNAEGLSLRFIDTPVMKSVENTIDGVKVEWEASAGAEYYRVFRKFGDDGNWTPKDIVTGTSFVDETVASGSVYHYTVRCVDAEGEGLSGRDETGLSIMFLKAPNLSAVSCANEGAKIYFGTVAGGASYEILRTDLTTVYTVIGSATESPYIDETAVSGTAYTYTVRAVSADGARSAYNAEGLSLRFIGTPEMKSVGNVYGGISVEWKSVRGAQYYRLYRKADESNWTPKNIIEGTSFFDTDVYSGSVYAYTVRPVDEDGEGIGGRDEEGLSILYLKAPELNRIDNVHGGVRVNFSTVAGAGAYEVFRKTDGDFELIGTTQEGSYTDATAVIGTTYTYTVRACQSLDAAAVRGAYNAEGLSILAEDVTSVVYVTRPSIGLYANYSDDEAVLFVPYMTALTYLETTKEWESGSWLKVSYNNSEYYVWVGAGEEKLTDTPSDYTYNYETVYQQEACQLALSFLRKSTGYAHGDSTGIADGDGVFWFDCSGFASYVMDAAMRAYVPTYNISANIQTLYETDGIYNDGLTGAYAVVTVIAAGDAFDESLLKPGDIIFFDLSEETDAMAEGLGYNHCGVYLGKGEFIHCTHSWGGGVCIMPLSGIYTDNFVSARRYLPVSVSPAGKTVYTTSQRTNMYAANDSNTDPVATYGAEVPLTLLFTDNGNWAYVSSGDREGFILVRYLADSIDEIALDQYVTKTSVKLYQSYTTSSDYIEVPIATCVTYNGRYSNSSYYKVTYGGENYYIYAKDGIGAVLCDSLEEALAVESSATVNANTWLRTAMDSNNDDNKIVMIRVGDAVDVIEISDSGTWAYIQTGGQYGYVLTSKLTIAE